MRSLYIVLVKLSTGLRHPSASQPTILVAEEDVEAEHSISLQISGDTLVVLVTYASFDDPNLNPREDSIQMYNWKTGKLQAVSISLHIDAQCPLKFFTDKKCSTGHIRLVCVRI
jgi:hypothetical protein